MVEQSDIPHISVVIPVFGYELDLDVLYDRLSKTLIKINDNYEIIMINDKSPNNAWDVIKRLAQNDQRVKGINLSRNFGQHQAVSAGLEFVRGTWCVVMDCDLQDQPEEIIKLYNEAQKGYEIVMGRRLLRKDSVIKRVTSRLFYILFNYLSDQKLDNRVANFGIYSKKVINEINKFSERDRSFGLLVNLVGFSKKIINVEHGKRKIGPSGYSFKKRFRMAENHIFSHSTKPLRIAVRIGVIITIISVLYALYLIIKYIIYSSSVPGWTSLMVSLFFLFGVLITLLGVVGLYVGKIYNEVKKRPLYIIDSMTFEVDS
jgi:polyisoprenyl-phosphate glycosyltransferase